MGRAHIIFRVWIGLLVACLPALAAPTVARPPLSGSSPVTAAAEKGGGAEELFAGGAPVLPADVPWWEQFGDPALTSAVEEALRGNHDMAAAAARLEASLAEIRIAEAAGAPKVGFETRVTASPSEALGFQFGGGSFGGGGRTLPAVIYNGSSLVTAAYRVDLWEVSELNTRAQGLAALASRGDRDGFALALTTQVGDAYLDAAAATEQLARLEAQVAANRSLLELVELRFRTGVTAGLDVIQQKGQLAGAEARVGAGRIQRETALRRLAAAMGRLATGRSPAVSASLPALPSATGCGGPSRLLEDRPDLRAARARFQAAGTRAERASRQWLPSLDLTGNVGLQAFLGDELRSTRTYAAGFAINFPIFDAGAVEAEEDRARAERSSLEHGHEQLLLRAVSEVESALVREREQGRSLEALERASREARRGFEESRHRYATGLETFVTVLAALTAAHQTELEVVGGRRELLAARLALHQSLGGSWTRELLPASGKESR